MAKSFDKRFSGRVLRAYDSAHLPEALEIRAAAADAPAEILLYDEIGYWGVNASDFAAALAAAGEGPLTLRINSPGGDVFDGYAIYNMLRARTAPVNVIIDGVAASAASFIAMAGATLAMGEPSMLMIHNASGFCFGTRADMRDLAAVLEKIDGQIAAIYAAKSGKTPEEMAAAMDAETWYTSTEAKASGLCDIVAAPPAKDALAGRPASRLPRLSRMANAAVRPRAAIDPYDPDEDGDNDAQEAFDSIGAAMTHLSAAQRALSGDAGDDAAAARLAERLAEPETTAEPSAADVAKTRLRSMAHRLRIAAAEAA